MQTRIGTIPLAIPQNRGVEFYPQAIERGKCSDRALKLALAEVYVQGVSTRKVAAVTEQLCGHEVSSSQVSRAAELLDANVPKSLTVLRLPTAHRRRLRTTNMLERLNEEINRRT